jgi:hypothetical protein
MLGVWLSAAINLSGAARNVEEPRSLAEVRRSRGLNPMKLFLFLMLIAQRQAKFRVCTSYYGYAR